MLESTIRFNIFISQLFLKTISHLLGVLLSNGTFENFENQHEEHAGPVVEYSTRDLGIGGLSLTVGTALCPSARHFLLC